MANTTNYNLTKPAEGANNVAGDYADNMDIIDNRMKLNADAVTDHIADTTAHAAANITSEAINSNTNVQAILWSLFNGKSSIGHTHSGYALAADLFCVPVLTSKVDTP